jgi:hypothetical protein
MAPLLQIYPGVLGTKRSEISDSHGGEYEDDCLLECCVVYSGRRLSTF